MGSRIEFRHAGQQSCAMQYMAVRKTLWCIPFQEANVALDPVAILGMWQIVHVRLISTSPVKLDPVTEQDFL